MSKLLRSRKPSQEEIDIIRKSSDDDRALAKSMNLPKCVIAKYRPRSNPKKKPKKIRQVSEKMSEGLKLYRQVKKELLENAVCAACGNADNLSIHHIAGRSGRLLYERENLIVVCLAGSDLLNQKYPESNHRDGCHNWIESNLKIARTIGLSKSKLWKEK
jgi:Zn ribbon nucleic-acid-binding protein